MISLNSTPNAKHDRGQLFKHLQKPRLAASRDTAFQAQGFTFFFNDGLGL